MSAVFSKPKILSRAITPEPASDVRMVQEDADVSRRREKKKLLTGGRRSTILSGIQSTLKKRLGE